MLARDEATDDLVRFSQSGSTWRWPQRLAAGPGGDFSPSVASWGPRRLDVFATTPAGTVAQFWFDGRRWRGWSDKGHGPDGRALVTAAAVAAWDKGRLDMFALVSGGQMIAHKWYDAGSWRGTQGLSTGPDRIRLPGSGATSWGTHRLDVFATDQQTHSLVQRYFSGAGVVRSGWTSTPSQ